MLILEAQNVKKYYGDRLIFVLEDLKVYTGDRIGIIGLNGSGKTTLLNILAGETEPDEGVVRHFCNIAYIRQFSQEEICADQKLISEFSLSGKTDQQVYSGGEQTRIKIANAFSEDNLLVFADEPTSNLDYKGVELLAAKLEKVPSFLLISHDRYLLDSLCNRIIEVKDGSIRTFSGNYSDYREQNELECRNAEMEYEKYVSEKVKLESAIRNRKDRSTSMRKAPKRMGNSEARLHTRAANEKQEKVNNAANSLKTRIEKLEVKEKPREQPTIKLDFSLTRPPANKIILSATRLTFSYGTRKIIDNACFDIPNHTKTALWGENGTGKTTLLNLIYNQSTDAIKIVPQAVMGYFHQSFENLDFHQSILHNVMKSSVQSETVARSILARLLITRDAVHKNVGVLSGGEKIKVSFAKLFVSDANVLLLDEPTNYLDMASMKALEEVLKSYEGTVVFVSHDREFVNSVADRLLILENAKITAFDGKLNDYHKSLKQDTESVASGMGKMTLQMKLSEIIARMSSPKADKDALEQEYAKVVEQLKMLN
ncbi:MAG: ABC-F type ribosomal protection protein [Thermoclostridium sp.]|nr:ABC-F type ribosomal protection protein [Thermoclostridium sp.]